MKNHWTDEKVKKGINDCMVALNIKRMTTKHSKKGGVINV